MPGCKFAVQGRLGTAAVTEDKIKRTVHDARNAESIQIACDDLWIWYIKIGIIRNFTVGFTPRSRAVQGTSVAHRVPANASTNSATAELVLERPTVSRSSLIRIRGHTLSAQSALKREVMVVDHGSEATVITARKSLAITELDRAKRRRQFRMPPADFVSTVILLNLFSILPQASQVRFSAPQHVTEEARRLRGRGLLLIWRSRRR